ncbi:hypothetical protein CHISP_2655 [Chitinispirillum alkaliphilum]|nr:hypothetical protein CHISP_2655 [Chitinispirillum alkaliphilum]
MKIVKAVVIVIHFVIQFTVFASSDHYDAKKVILSTLFPMGEFSNIDDLFGTGEKGVIQIIPNLRGRHGFVDFSRTKLLFLDDSVAVIAFDIFLCGKEISLDSVLTNPLRENPPNSLKLLQMLFVNTNNNSILAKPSEFPMVTQQWICTGDICDQVTVTDLQEIDIKRRAFILSYSRNVGDNFIQAHVFHSGENIKNSADYQVGSLGGSSGCDIERRIEKFSIDSNRVVMHVETFCESSCDDICDQMGIGSGENNLQIEILELGDS